MKNRALGILMMVAVSLAGMPAWAANTHDLQVTITETNTTSNTFAKPGTLKVTVKVKNNGPQAVVYDDGTYVFGVNKFDHTGQQLVKQVAKRDVPLLSAPGGTIADFTFTFEESEPPTGKFFYRAFVGKASGYYTDSANTNNTAEVFLTIGDRISWTTRLLPDHFKKAEVTNLSTAQLQKLNQTAYSLADMVSSNTDRLVDGSKCSSCHTGQAGQSAAKYRPDLSSLPVPANRNHRPTPSSNVTAGYNWSNSNQSETVALKFKGNNTKNEILRRVIYYWYITGARQNP